MIKVKAKEVKHIIDATFPAYRKQSVYIWPGETVTLHDLNWSGGSRSEYQFCSLAGQPIKTNFDMHSPAPWNNKYEGQVINIPEGFAVIQGGHFCGKVATLSIHVNPASMPKLITS